MKKIWNTIKASIGLGLLATTNVTMAAGNVRFTNWSEERLKTTDNPLDQVITNWINYISTFLGLIAVCIGLWWAFNILTAAGDEEKVKTGKAIIIRAVLWLVAVFAVNIIMRFVISALFNNS